MAFETNKAVGTSESNRLTVPSQSQTPSVDGKKVENSPIDSKNDSTTTELITKSDQLASPSIPATSSEEKESTEAKSKDEEKTPVSSKFAALSRKERQVVAKQQELKLEEAKLVESKAKLESEIAQSKAKMEAEIAESRKALEADLKKVQEFESLKKVGALKALEALGYTYQQATDEILNDSKPTPEHLINTKAKELEEKLAKFEKQQADKEKAEEDKAARLAKEAEEKAAKALEDEKNKLEQERTEVITKFRSEINDFIKKNSDKYELINLHEANEIVFATIEAHYEDTLKKGKPEVLSIPEASELVEQYLEEQVQKSLATNRLKAKVSSPKQEPNKENNEVIDSKANAINTPANNKTKTLSNEMTSASGASLPAKSERERIQRALAALDKLA